MRCGVTPYSAYRRLDGKLLHNVPPHWEVERLKRVCRLAYGDALSAESRVPGTVSVVGSNGPVGSHDSANTRGPCIVIGRKGSFGKVNYFQEPVFAIDTTFFVDNRLSAAHLRWLYYALTRLHLDAVTKDSAIPGLDREDVYQRVVAVPAPQELRAIVCFLDHADRRIQRYIRAKERLIELLEEQKQAVIHRAVTGRIDVRTGQPYPAYKDSGVEWLGEVPEQWEVVQVGRVTRDRCDGPFGSGLKSSHYTDAGVRVVRLQNIGHGEFLAENAAFVSREHCAWLGDHSVVAGDVLVAGLGDDRRPAGRACIAPREIEPAMVKADCFRFRLDQARAHSPFIALQFTATARTASAILSTGATRQRTNLQSTACRAIALPEIREQARIVDYVTTRTGCIEEALDGARCAIDLLAEYRTRLIADVVTGILDVREAAASLPETDPLTTDDPRHNPATPVTTQGDIPNPAHSHPHP